MEESLLVDLDLVVVSVLPDTLVHQLHRLCASLEHTQQQGLPHARRVQMDICAPRDRLIHMEGLLPVDLVLVAAYALLATRVAALQRVYALLGDIRHLDPLYARHAPQEPTRLKEQGRARHVLLERILV